VIPAAPGVGPMPAVTATQRLISAAAVFGARTALAGSSPEAQFSFADLAGTVQRAAAGLAWRGLRPRDVVGVFVPDAVCFVLACHAISAAGGIPSPLSTELSVPEMAGQLADCGARMILTSQPLATAALAASDRSWVRQVISFGEAPAATPFDSLLGMGSMPPPGARPHELAMLPYVRQPDGTLRASGQTHVTITAELRALATTAALGLQDVVLATPPTGDGRSYGVFLDHALLSGATVVAAGPDELDAAADEHRGTAAVIRLGTAVPDTAPLRLFTVAS
jgi:acyl-CoA synthetase (AMP-forming)/AMP-acid ligase II